MPLVLWACLAVIASQIISVLLWLNGADLRQEALVDRKAELRKLVRGRAGVLYADHLRGGAVEIFRASCAQDLEGIVIKAARGPYS